MATVDKAFRVKNGLVVEGATATVNTHDVITKEIFDAKGDLLVGTGSNTGTRVALGTNGYVLTADSNETNGVKWAAAPAVGSFETSIVFEGTTANDFETTLQVTDPTADRTITFPDVSGTVITTGDSGTVTSAMIENGTIVNGDISASAEIAQSKISGLTTDLGNKASSSDLTTHTGATEAHGATGAVVGTTNTQTLTNKTLTSPVINTPTGITKSDVGLANVDNTSDANKPVSTATQTALDAKLALSGGTMTGAIAMGANKITGLGTPTDSADAATKAYVDAVSEGLHIHPAARIAILTNVAIATGLENGDTAGGVTLATGDRVLVNGQSTASENGIYVVQASGQALRATDFDTATEVDSGDFIFVSSGTYANTGWVQTLKPATIGTDPISFTQFSGAGTFTAGNGLTLDGTVFSIDTTITQTRVADVSDTEIGYLNGVTSAIQTQLNSKFASADASTTNISEGSNLYFTNERAQDAIGNNVGTGLSYNDTTGAISVTENTYEPYGAATTAQNALDDVLDATTAFTAINVNSVAKQVAATTGNIVTAAATTAYSWAKASYRSAEFLVKSKTSTHTEVTKIMLTLDSSDNVYLTEYGMSSTSGTSLQSITADISGTDVRIRVTPANNNTEVLITGTLLV